MATPPAVKHAPETSTARTHEAPSQAVADASAVAARDAKVKASVEAKDATGTAPKGYVRARIPARYGRVGVRQPGKDGLPGGHIVDYQPGDIVFMPARQAQDIGAEDPSSTSEAPKGLNEAALAKAISDGERDLEK